MKTISGTRTSIIYSRSRTFILGYTFTLWLCTPLVGLGQSSDEFDHLIFEPATVPLTEPLAVPQATPEDAAPAVTASQAAAPTTTQDTADAEAEIGEPAQPDSSLRTEIGRYEEALNTSLQNQDQYSQQLREQYEALGLLLQQDGDHERAITMFENAMQIDRVNNGLFTTLQIPLVRQIIESQKALGNVEEVADLQGYLYYVHQKSFAADSEEFLAAKEAWADWNVEYYLQEGGNGLTGNYALFGMINSASPLNDYVPIQNPITREFTYVPRHQLPLALNPANMGAIDLYMQSSQYAITPEQLIDERLRTAEDLYEEILETRTVQNPESSTAAVQHKLANIAFAVKRQMDVLESRMDSGLGFDSITQQSQPNLLVRRGYSKNLEALEMIAQELESSPNATPAEKAHAYINLGDWNVSFDRVQRSEDAYAKAWQILRDAGFTDSEITGIFLPQPLVPVPAYVTHEFSRAFYGYPADAELEYKGHIDTTVDVDRFGRVSNIRIDSESADTPYSVHESLLTYLREKKMRPPLVNGELVKLTDIKVRYYYSY